MEQSRLERILRRTPGVRSVFWRLRRFRRPSGRQDPRAVVLKRLPSGSVGMEVGVHLGDFSQRLLDEVRPKELHLVDPWEHQTTPAYTKAWYGGHAKGGAEEMARRFASVKNRFAAAIDAGTVKVHRGSSQAVLAQFPDGYLDWIYIDGNHLYEYVKLDLEMASRKVRPGGYIAGDDYGNAGWWHDGVTKAVDEFAEAHAMGDLSIFGNQFIMRSG
jgi:predicted dehydrogenase